MKKLFIAVFVMLIGLAFTAPSFAVEHEFGGYWRVRMFSMKNFDGSSDATGAAATPNWVLNPKTNVVGNTTAGDTDYDDVTMADTRTRLFYTATINDNLKFVNAFEMDADWGIGGRDYGDLGADGVAVEVKHTYADFNIGALNAKVGTQPTAIHRGFVFADDFSGVILSAAGVTAKYMKIEENDDNAGYDETLYSLAYTADLDTVKLTPVFTYVDYADEDYVWYAGLDVDADLGAASLWGTFIYNGGEDKNVGTPDVDVKAWLVAAGGTFKLTDTFDIHGQAFYATGDDSGKDEEGFQIVGVPGLTGTSYYWSEIMGKGLFDDFASNNSPGNAPTNITAVNLGVTVSPMEKLTLAADLWYATLNEELSAGIDEDLGFEIDLRATYQLVDGLNLDIVGAYLFAGDSTQANATNTAKVANDEDPWEIGTQLSLSF